MSCSLDRNQCLNYELVNVANKEIHLQRYPQIEIITSDFNPKLTRECEQSGGAVISTKLQMIAEKSIWPGGHKKKKNPFQVRCEISPELLHSTYTDTICYVLVCWGGGQIIDIIHLLYAVVS